ncbi:MAG: superoxide dismutase [Candidatus Bathyarchaeia archaeon]
MPKLSYDLKDLAPYVSEEQLRIHHVKHHQAYVNGANTIFQKLEKARKESTNLDIKSTLKELSFHIGGHILHSLFWKNVTPAEKSGGTPGGALADVIQKEFGSFERFKKEFSQAAISVEGSGWVALTVDFLTKKLLITHIEKHNLNVYPTFKILMVLDVWEHAYYLDYRNERAKFVDAFWNIDNWNEVNRRLKESLK